MKTLIFFLLFLLGAVSLKAQDIAKIDWKKPVKLSGSLGVSTMFYDATGVANRRDPFFWQINGNLNINLLGFLNVPVTVNFSQQNNQYAAQPFNQFGLSPSYKAVKVHLGYRTMEFSPFTLSGQVFMGAGIEITPQNSLVRVSAMYGRFAKAISQGGQIGILSGAPSYERWGYGAKIGLGRNLAKSVDLIFFKAKDDINSIPPQEILRPAENLVLGLVTKQTFLKKFAWNLDLGYSIYTSHANLESIENQGFTDNIIKINLSTQKSMALKTGLSYSTEAYQISLNYQRINPKYQSMGTAFLNNDLEDIALMLSWKMFANKMQITAGGGFQRNNLDKSLATDLTRLSYNFNINYSATEKLNFTLNYSNFNSSTKILASAQQITDPTLRLDSLRLLQVTNSANFMASYATGTKEKKHSLSFAAAYQGANDQNNVATSFYNASLGYNFSLTPKNLSLSSALSFNQNSAAGIENLTLGPTLGINKLFFKKKMKCTYAGSLLNAYINGVQNSLILTQKLAASYSAGKHHSFAADMNYLQKADEKTKMSEIRAGLNYNYTF